MRISDYLKDISEEMVRKSAAIRRDFATHRLSAGENREDLVRIFLREHLPLRFATERGLIVSEDNVFSNQADLLIADAIHNTPLYSAATNKLWPVEATYALVEVKTSLGPADIADAVAKIRRYKLLPRTFLPALSTQHTESLGVVWAFEGPSPEQLKKNVEVALASVPRSEQPDLWVIPGKVAIQSGVFREITQIGRPSSPYRQELTIRLGRDPRQDLSDEANVWDFGENALLAWFTWLDSWFQHIDYRGPATLSNLAGQITGRLVT